MPPCKTFLNSSLLDLQIHLHLLGTSHVIHTWDNSAKTTKRSPVPHLWFLGQTTPNMVLQRQPPTQRLDPNLSPGRLKIHFKKLDFPPIKNLAGQTRAPTATIQRQKQH